MYTVCAVRECFGCDVRFEMREFFAGIRILYDVKVVTPFSAAARFGLCECVLVRVYMFYVARSCDARCGDRERANFVSATRRRT